MMNYNNWDTANEEMLRLRDLVDQLFDQRADAEVLAYARERLAEAEAAEREAWISEQTRAAFCHCSDCVEQIRRKALKEI